MILHLLCTNNSREHNRILLHIKFRTVMQWILFLQNTSPWLNLTNTNAIQQFHE